MKNLREDYQDDYLFKSPLYIPGYTGHQDDISPEKRKERKEEIEKIAMNASLADIVKGLKKFFSSEEVKFIEQIDSDAFERSAKEIYRKDEYSALKKENIYLLMVGDSYVTSPVYSIYGVDSYSSKYDLNFKELKDIYDKDPEFYNHYYEIGVRLLYKDKIKDRDIYESLITFTILLPIMRQRLDRIEKEREEQRAEAKRKAALPRINIKLKIPPLSGFNNAQRKLLDYVKNHIEYDIKDTEDLEKYLEILNDPKALEEAVEDTSHMLWDMYDIEIPNYYILRHGGYPRSSSEQEDLDRDYFYDKIWDDKFKRAVLSLYQQLKTAKNESFKYSRSDKKQLEEANHFDDIMNRTTPKKQKELLFYIEQHLKNFGGYYDDFDGNVKDIAYYEFTEGDGVGIIIPDAYVLAKGGDPDNVSDDIVEDYFDELWDSSLKKRIRDLLAKYKEI